MKCKFRVVLTKEARFDLRKLDTGIVKRILLKLEYFRSSENPLYFAKKLRDCSLGNYRFRIGNYRVIFDVLPDGTITILNILSIRHRRHVY